MSEAITSSVWKTLLGTEAPVRPRSGAPKANAQDRKAANKSMWTAIDQNDLVGMEEAIFAGASFNNRREGQTPLWRAVSGGQWEIAESLRGHGADIHAETMAHQTMFGALAVRDNTEEADRLLTWGCDPTKTPGEQFLSFGGAPRLLQWWLEHGNMANIPKQKTHTNETILGWAKVAMRGTPKLREHLNQAWGVSGKDPNDFAKAFRSQDNVADQLWTAIIHKDDISLARACLESGWGLPIDNGDPCWRLARGGAWHILDWFRQVPQFKRNMMAVAAEHPERTWWAVAKNNLPSLERVLALGVDLGCKNEKGQTIAHEALAQYDLKKPIVLWFAAYHPEMLDEPDNDGATPMTKIRDGELRAQMEAAVMARSAPKVKPASGGSRRL